MKFVSIVYPDKSVTSLNVDNIVSVDVIRLGSIVANGVPTPESAEVVIATVNHSLKISMRSKDVQAAVDWADRFMLACMTCERVSKIGVL